MQGRKLAINQQNCSQTSGTGRRSLLNLTKVCIKWINENEHGKEWYCTECYNNYLDLITIDESSGDKLEVASHNDYAPHEIIHLNFFHNSA